MPPELFGREVELTRLAQVAEAARAGGGAVVLLAGEAGVGKTVLARAALARAGLRTLEAAAAESAAPAYAPLVEILRAGLRSRTLGLENQPLLRRCLSVILPELGSVDSREPDSRLLLEAIAAAVAEMAGGEPLGVLLDDLHWADTASLDTLAHLAEVVPNLPVLVIATYRTDDLPRGHPVRRLRSELRRRGRLLEVRVDPLDASSTQRLLEDRIGGPVSARLAGAIQAATEGLPFFVEEIASALQESDALQQGTGGLDLEPDQALPLPESVRDAILQRVERMPAEVRDALAAAAVIGRDFELTMLAGVAGEDAAARLPDGGLVLEREPGRLAFRHSLIRDAVYDSVPWMRRRALHRVVAEQLEAAGAPAAAVAEHRLAAGEPALARTWLLAAADAAWRTCAYRDAAVAITHALDLWPAEDDGRRRLDALELLARCAELSGGTAAGIRALSEAIELLDAGGDLPRLARARRRLAALLEQQGAWERAVTVRHLAADAFASAGDPAEAAAEYLAAAARLRSAACFQAALEMISAGRAQAEKAGRDDLGRRLVALEGNVRARAGQPEAGLSLVRASLDAGLAAGDYAGAAEAYQRLADALEHARDYRGARATYLEAAGFCERHEQAATGDVCLACLTMVLRQTGEWDQAAGICREVLASPSSNPHAQAVAHGVLGAILAHRGRFAHARPALHSSNVIARRIGLAAMEMDSEAGLARLAAASGANEEAIERAWRVVRAWQRTDGERHYAIPPLRWIATLAAETAANGLLNAATSALVSIAEQPDAEARSAAGHALAEGLLMAGDAAGAAARFEQSLALLADIDLPLERAEVERRSAAAHALAGNRSLAVDRYRSAYRTAIRLGARPLAGGIAQAVAALGEKVERRLGRLAASGLGVSGLSPRELEVARLVAGGLTSREIAIRLSLSPRTIEMHVHRILGKLDCRTRVDITRRAAELGFLS